jgi:uncharacterized membrane protein YhiD involved in acid resistance
MEHFFSEQTYYEFPSLEAAIYALLLSFLLSSVIALIYRVTFRGANYSKEFFQAVVLVSIIAATVMMAIGDSLARGLGILGALAIIRFRFRFVNPRNIIYIFASLAVGIACGVYGFAIALAGTIVFSLVSIALYFSPVGKKAGELETSISFLLDNDEKLISIETIFSEYCNLIRLVSIGSVKDMIKYEYQVSLKRGIDRKDLYSKLKEIENIGNLRIDTRASVDRV